MPFTEAGIYMEDDSCESTLNNKIDRENYSQSEYD